MGLKGRLKRLQRLARGKQIPIRQHDGRVLYFPESDLKEAYLNALDRATLGPEERPEEHPLVAAVRNSPDPEWISSVYSLEPNEGVVEDLSEP